MPILAILSTYRHLFVLGAFLCLLGGVYIKGHSDGVDGERKEWQAAQTQVLETQLKEIERQKKENAVLVAKYQEVEHQRNIYYRKLQDEINAATNGDRCLGSGAVRVWNQAIGNARDLPRTTSGTAKAPASSGATDREVLTNHVDNMRQYSECRDLHEKLIEWRDKNFGGK
jgi:hypothetical protein